MRLLMAALTDRERTDMIVDDLEDMGYSRDEISLIAKLTYIKPTCRLLCPLNHSDLPQKIYKEQKIVIGGPLAYYSEMLPAAPGGRSSDILSLLLHSLQVPDMNQRCIYSIIGKGGSVIALPLTRSDGSPRDLLESYSAQCICEVSLPVQSVRAS